MKKYVFVKKHDLTEGMISCSLLEKKSLSVVGDFYILPMRELDFSPCFDGYLKFTESEADTAKSHIESGKIFINKSQPLVQKRSPFAEKSLPTGEKLFKRIHGMGKLTLAAGEAGDFEFQIPYAWAKLEGIMLMDQIDEIQAELFVEDSDEGLYTTIPRYELNKFGFEVEIPKTTFEKKSDYDSDLFEDMWIVLQITNTSNQTQTVRANVELDEVRA